MEERKKIHQILPRKGIAPKSLFFRALYFLSYLGFVNFGVLEFFIEWNVERLGSKQILKTLTLKNSTKRSENFMQKQLRHTIKKRANQISSEQTSENN